MDLTQSAPAEPNQSAEPAGNAREPPSGQATPNVLVQLNNIIGQHVVRNISYRKDGGPKRKTLTVAEVLNRDFINSFGVGDELRPAFSPWGSRVIDKIDNFIKTPRENMRSLAKCQTVLFGIALHKFRNELGLDDPNITPQKRKNLNNQFTTVQRTDRPASKRFLTAFCLKYNVSGETALAEVERKCKVAVVILNHDGCIEAISSSIINNDYSIVTIMKSNGQIYLGKLKGLCRVDMPKVKRGVAKTDGASPLAKVESNRG